MGEGGWCRPRADAGATWRAAPGELPPAARQFDFAALAVRGPKCWIAGTPGTRVFQTADAGRTWTASATGSNVPLRAIAFADDQHGWAAGDLGTILATADGGRTWQRQRADNSRAALLGIFAEPEQVPLELIARLSAGEGFLSVVDADPVAGGHGRESEGEIRIFGDAAAQIRVIKAASLRTKFNCWI